MDKNFKKIFFMDLFLQIIFFFFYKTSINPEKGEDDTSRIRKYWEQGEEGYGERERGILLTIAYISSKLFMCKV